MRSLNLRLAALGTAASLLSGCAVGPSSRACPPPVEYTAAQLDQVADEIERHLPEHSMIERFLSDYTTERDQLKDCQ